MVNFFSSGVRHVTRGSVISVVTSSMFLSKGAKCSCLYRKELFKLICFETDYCTVFWDLAACIPVQVHLCFGGRYYLSVQGQ